MNARHRPKQTLVGIELVRLLAREGERIFTTNRARELAPRVGLKGSYVCEALYHLRNNDWIIHLRRGLYALSSTVPGISAVNEFEVAMALADPAAISHWSAFQHHGLTQQVPKTVFVLTTNRTSVPRMRRAGTANAGGGYTVGDTTYRFVQVKPDRFFGRERVWVNDTRVWVTNLERTLLDGLSMPRYCGDFAEVLHAFLVGLDRLDADRIVRYALRLDVATAKRLGWVLEHHGHSTSRNDDLAALPIRGYRTLDPSGPREGPRSNRWNIQENLPGLIDA